MPRLDGIDHVHVYVKNRTQAAAWYADVLGLRAVEKFSVWATPKGPLVVEDGSGRVHLALFESDRTPESIAAFEVSGDQFEAWREHLGEKSIEFRYADHDLSESLYFDDPDGNAYEITRNRVIPSR